MLETIVTILSGAFLVAVFAGGLATVVVGLSRAVAGVLRNRSAHAHHV